MPTVTGSIAVTADDIEIDGGSGPTLYTNGEAANEAFAGRNVGACVWMGLRFTLSGAIPSGATITAATFQLYGTSTWNWGSATDYLRVFVTDSSDAAQVTTQAARPSVDSGSTTVYPTTLAGGTRWPAANGLSWPTAQYNTSVDLSALIQHLVDTYSGLASGAHVMVWAAGDTSADNNSEIGWQDSNAGTNPPTLAITYTTGGGSALVHPVAEALGLTEAAPSVRGLFRRTAEALGLAEATRRLLGAVRVRSDAVGTTETTARPRHMVRRTLEALGIGEAVDAGLALLLIIAEDLGLTEATRRVAGFVRRTSETVGLTEGSRRLLGLVRRVSEALGLTEAVRRVLVAGGTTLVRVRTEAVALTEAVARRAGVVRRIASTLAITESAPRAMRLVRAVVETLGITTIIRRLLNAFIPSPPVRPTTVDFVDDPTTADLQE